MGLSFLEKVGLVSLSMIGVQFFRNLMHIFYDHCLAQRTFHHNVNLKKMGKWAVVTGATSGIGKAYARQLAKIGLGVVLISRDKVKLETVSSELQSEFHIPTRIIVADFTNNAPEAYHEMEKKMYGLEIGVLINNVGMSYPHPEYFLELPHSDKIFSNIIKCNIYSVTNMCAILMPQMVERGRGVVVNISSTTATIPSPLLTVYAASKAYIETFSRNLEFEYGSRGVTIQCLLPGYVATKMSRIKRATCMAPSPEEYVEGAIQLIGIQTVCTGYLPHTAMAYVIHMFETLSPSFAGWVIRRTMENLRSRAIRKYVG